MSVNSPESGSSPCPFSRCVTICTRLCAHMHAPGPNSAQPELRNCTSLFQGWSAVQRDKCCVGRTARWVEQGQEQLVRTTRHQNTHHMHPVRACRTVHIPSSQGTLQRRRSAFEALHCPRSRPGPNRHKLALVLQRWVLYTL